MRLHSWAMCVAMCITTLGSTAHAFGPRLRCSKCTHCPTATDITATPDTAASSPNVISKSAFALCTNLEVAWRCMGFTRCGFNYCAFAGFPFHLTPSMHSTHWLACTTSYMSVRCIRRIMHITPLVTHPIYAECTAEFGATHPHTCT